MSSCCLCIHPSVQEMQQSSLTQNGNDDTVFPAKISSVAILVHVFMWARAQRSCLFTCSQTLLYAVYSTLESEMESCLCKA